MKSFCRNSLKHGHFIRLDYSWIHLKSTHQITEQLKIFCFSFIAFIISSARCHRTFLCKYLCGLLTTLCLDAGWVGAVGYFLDTICTEMVNKYLTICESDCKLREYILLFKIKGIPNCKSLSKIPKILMATLTPPSGRRSRMENRFIWKETRVLIVCS